MPRSVLAIARRCHCALRRLVPGLRPGLAAIDAAASSRTHVHRRRSGPRFGPGLESRRRRAGAHAHGGRRRSPRLFVLGLAALTACASGPAAATQALIALEADLPHIEVRIAAPQGPEQPCPAGQYWHIGSMGCSQAVALRSVSTERACACSCPAGQFGACTASQIGSHTVYGWLTPPHGVEKHSHDGPLRWEACRRTHSTCLPPRTPPPDPPPSPPPSPPPTPAPRPNDTFEIPARISSMICGPGDPGYGLGSSLVDNRYRDRLISHYRSLGVAGRCPEASGYAYWLDDWLGRAVPIGTARFTAAGGGAAGNDYRVFIDKAMGEVWAEVRDAINYSGDLNDEQGAGGIAAGNLECARAAKELYPEHTLTVQYILRSGNRCRVIQAH